MFQKYPFEILYEISILLKDNIALYVINTGII